MMKEHVAKAYRQAARMQKLVEAIGYPCTITEARQLYVKWRGFRDWDAMIRHDRLQMRKKTDDL